MIVVSEGLQGTSLHPMKFHDFAMVLSDSQLELLAFMLGIHESSTDALATRVQRELPPSFKWFMGKVMRGPLRKNNTVNVQPCAWNMLLSRRYACGIINSVSCSGTRFSNEYSGTVPAQSNSTKVCLRDDMVPRLF